MLPFKGLEVGMTNRTSKTGMSVLNCEKLCMQDNGSQVTLGPINPSYMELGNFQSANMPALGALPFVEFGNAGVSTLASPGGWDLDGPAPAGKHCYIWAVCDGVLHNPASVTKYGLVLSRRGYNGGPHLDPSWTHSQRVGWNYSTGSGFAYSLIRNELRTYFVGGISNDGNLPVIFAGLAARWTPMSNIVNFASENAGAFGLHIRNHDAGCIVGIAPNQFWSGEPIGYINNYPNQLDQAMIVEVFTDAGAPCVWSNTSLGTVSMAYFDDAY